MCCLQLSGDTSSCRLLLCLGEPWVQDRALLHRICFPRGRSSQMWLESSDLSLSVWVSLETKNSARNGVEDAVGAPSCPQCLLSP